MPLSHHLKIMSFPSYIKAFGEYSMDSPEVSMFVSMFVASFRLESLPHLPMPKKRRKSGLTTRLHRLNNACKGFGHILLGLEKRRHWIHLKDRDIVIASFEKDFSARRTWSCPFPKRVYSSSFHCQENLAQAPQPRRAFKPPTTPLRLLIRHLHRWPKSLPISATYNVIKILGRLLRQRWDQQYFKRWKDDLWWQGRFPVQWDAVFVGRITENLSDHTETRKEQTNVMSGALPRAPCDLSRMVEITWLWLWIMKRI